MHRTIEAHKVNAPMPTDDHRLGAPEPEIEITPEMIAAGEDVLTGNLGGAVSANWSAPDLAVEVYRAMLLCRRKPKMTRSSRRNSEGLARGVEGTSKL